MKIKYNTAIILAGGIGTRMKNKIPKQFLLLSNKKIFEYSLSTFLENKNIHQIILVCHKDWIKKTEIKNKRIVVVQGGDNRTESVFLGLKKCHFKCNNVVIHDAARPFISNKLVNEGLSYLNKFDAAVPFIDIKDSIINMNKQDSIRYLNRKNIKIVQTPQFFIYEKISTAYKNNENIFTDDLSLILDFNKNTSYKFFEGAESNFKITSISDYELATKILG